jgi:hypothetical protein
MLRSCDLDVASVLKFQEFLLDQENSDQSLKRIEEFRLDEETRSVTGFDPVSRCLEP